MATSALQQWKKQQEELDKIRDAAKEEALEKANQAIADLTALGFNYRLVEGDRGDRVRRTRQRRDVPCPTCGFRTNPPHDLRAHRGHKKAFTEAELAEKGLTRVSD